MQRLPADSAMASSPGDEAHILLTDLESHAGLLMRRVQRLQGRQCQRHLQKHIQSFVRREQDTSGLGCQLNARKVRDNSAAHSNGRIQHKNLPAADPIRFLDRDGVKNMPTSALVDIVRSWESQTLGADNFRLQAAAAPALTPGRNNTSSSTHPDADVSDSNASDQNNAALVKLLRSPAYSDAAGMQSVDRADAAKIECSAGQLRANLEHLQEDYDSDATESSSGGESCDDGCSFWDKSSPAGYHSGLPSPLCSKNQTAVSLRDSMTWTWAVQRGAIACRWMWLIAQVADLEFKIRQQNEMYRTLRLSKGPITLENIASEAQDSTKSSSDGHSAEASQCVRTMPLRNLKKRKLVRSNAALAGAVRKVARYSTVQCSCSSLPNFVSPCVLCNGRYGYVQVIDTDCMPQHERIAILDPSCHPVLSLPTQIPLGLHFSKFLKKETVQKTVVRKVNNKNRKKPGTTSSPESPSKFLKDIRRSNHKKSHALISSSKLKKKYDSKRKYPHNNCEYPSSGKRSKAGRERHESSSNGSNDSSRQDSPIQSPLPTETSAPRRRRSEYAYDINNIVIPYSIASTTRVEKLQYKEILTPKWREIDFYNSQLEAVQSEEEDVEDLSDVTFNERHTRCEADEKKRFLTFLTPNAPPGSGPKRARGARVRYDSKGDVPAPAVTGNNGYGNHTEDCNSQDSEISNHNVHTHTNNTTSHNNSHSTHSKDVGAPAKDPESLVHGSPARAFERRRTTSSSRNRDDSVDDEHLPDVQPFEKRVFPLAPADVDELVSDTDEPLLEMNGKHEQENGNECVSPEKAVITNHADNSASEPVTPLPGNSTGAVYASSSGDTDHDEEEDPEWEPKEQP